MDLTLNGDASSRKLSINAAKSIGAKISRNSFLWNNIERTKGNLDWTLTDSVVEELLTAGIEPIFCIYGSPSWANGIPSSVSEYNLYVPIDNTNFNEWIIYYKSFISAAITRYKGKVNKWELWNEENEHWFWKPKPNVNQYILWYQAIASVIKSIDPTAEVSLGALTGLSQSGVDDYNGNEFLKLIYQGNIRPDIISIHPYSKGAPDVHILWENNFDDIALIRQTMIDYGQTDKPIWVTEWGWPTSEVSLQTQADWLNISLDKLINQYKYVTIATYFVDHDRPPKYYQGLFTENYIAKPASLIFKKYAIPPPKVPSSPINIRIN